MKIPALLTFLLLSLSAPRCLANSCVSDSLARTVIGTTDTEEAMLKGTYGDLLHLPTQTPEKVAELNQEVLGHLTALPYPENLPASRKNQLTAAEIRQLYRDTEKNEQVSASLCGGYRGSSDGIGFCFGRAMAVHLKAVRTLSKDSVKKLWAVGQLETGSLSWRYHVTTLVRGPEGEWWAIDPIFARPMTAKDWFTTMRDRYDNEKKMRIFATSAERFGPTSASKYSKRDLGLKGYHGFFYDLIDSIARENTGKPSIWKNPNPIPR